MEGRTEVSLEDFKINRQLGSGAYAQVKLATHERTKVRVALKMYPKSKVNIGIRRKAVQQEIACMEKLENRHFPKLYTSFENDNEIVLVQEFVSGKSLFELLKQPCNKRGMTEKQAKGFFK